MKLFNYVLFAFLILLLTNCSTTKFLNDNELLLIKNKIQIDNKKISKADIETYIQPKPNKKLFGIIPFYLYVYNFANSGKERKFKNKIKEIVGEPPIVVNEQQIKHSIQQIRLFLKTKGYYYPQITDSIKINKFNKKKAIVLYYISTNKPYTIDSINWEVNDKNILRYLNEIKTFSSIRKSMVLDEDLLQQEREKITNFLKNRGFFYFTKDFIQYDVDTSLGNYKVLLTCKILNQQYIGSDGKIYEKPHIIYYIDSVFIHYNYNAKFALQNRQEYLASLDTLQFKNLFLVGNGYLTFKPYLFTRTNFIQQGDIYNVKDVQATYDKLVSLNTFKLVNIQFSEISNSNKLNAVIQLSPIPRQSYQAEIQGTNSSGNLGIACNINYTNRNLFGGAQNLQISLNGSVERQTAVIQENDQQIQQYLPFNSTEGGINLKYRVPSFLFPLVSEKFIKYNNPVTQFNVSYNLQQRPDYYRTISMLNFGYEWYGNKNLKHFINPIELNYVKIPYISWRFKKIIRGTFLENSFENHLETISSYGFIFNDNKVGKYKQNSVFIRGKFESSGNFLYLVQKKFSKTNDQGYYNILDVPFSQFIRAEIDYRYYKFISKNTKLIYRVFGGAGYPYGNSEVLPFNKRYFSGGGNSLRAWAVRSLGPGSSVDTTYKTVFNQTGDIKLESNIEYRFKLFWVVEPAIFVDAGNIWNIHKHYPDDKGYFRLTGFLNDIAISYGLGIRLNFGFFIFRTDVALKGRDPAESINNKWLFIQRKLSQDDFGFNIGIGYPF